VSHSFVVCTASQQGSANTTSKPSIGGPFTLIDYDGKLITDCEFLGHWTLIYFGYTSSPDTDPEELQKMAKVIDILGEPIFDGSFFECFSFLFDMEKYISIKIIMSSSNVILKIML
jgi:protein SCO1/2